VTAPSRAFGQEAEARAAELFRQKGYRVLAQNVRLPGGELDLIVQQKGVLVFVEVKARHTEAFGGAVGAIDARKQARLTRLAKLYLSGLSLPIPACRFDVVLYQGLSDGSLTVEHIENAFALSDEDV
jgi:putative endonuclease